MVPTTTIQSCDSAVSRIRRCSRFPSSPPHLVYQRGIISILTFSCTATMCSTVRTRDPKVGPYVLVRTDLPSIPRDDIPSQLPVIRSRLIPRHPIRYSLAFVMSTSAELSKSVSACARVVMAMYISDCSVCRP
jgi:hypothetical protein